MTIIVILLSEAAFVFFLLWRFKSSDLAKLTYVFKAMNTEEAVIEFFLREGKSRFDRQVGLWPHVTTVRRVVGYNLGKLRDPHEVLDQGVEF